MEVDTDRGSSCVTCHSVLMQPPKTTSQQVNLDFCASFYYTDDIFSNLVQYRVQSDIHQVNWSIPRNNGIGVSLWISDDNACQTSCHVTADIKVTYITGDTTVTSLVTL